VFYGVDGTADDPMNVGGSWWVDKMIAKKACTRIAVQQAFIMAGQLIREAQARFGCRAV
jgi:hypothetical protein